jgi:hypothetical protein
MPIPRRHGAKLSIELLPSTVAPLDSCPKQVKIDEHVLLTYDINNYLGKDLTNVMLRIRASPDFELFEESKPECVVSSIDKDYTLTISSLKLFGVETRHMVFVPKHTGIIQIIIEVESEFGGDYEILTIIVRESSIERKQLSVRLFDLTTEKKTYGPIVEKITPTPALHSVRFSISGKFIIFFPNYRDIYYFTFR